MATRLAIQFNSFDIVKFYCYSFYNFVHKVRLDYVKLYIRNETIVIVMLFLNEFKRKGVKCKYVITNSQYLDWYRN